MVIEIDVMEIGDKEYICLQDAARYLHLTPSSVDYYASMGKVRIERVESRWLLEWESVKTFKGKLTHKPRVNYEVKIVRSALPQV